MAHTYLAAPGSLKAIEQAILDIARAPGEDLFVSKDFASKRLGVLNDVARLQLLATWARHAPEGCLQFHGANDVPAVLEEWCEYAPGIVGLRMSQGVLVGDVRVDRREALVPAVSKMTATDALDLDRIIKGRTLDFCCVSGSKIQFLRPLFTSRDASSVKGKQGMFDLLKAVSKRVAQSDKDRIPDEFITACAVFCSELVRNTQEHATRDRQGQRYVEHVEGLLVGWHDDMQKEDFTEHERLNAFWGREQGRQNNEATLRTLQLSFFDTGPGFASRLTGKAVSDLSLDEERAAVLSSLRKNASTKREAGAGNGIPEVLEVLRRLGGLITIRTGRLRLFQAFSPNEDADPFAFDDWFQAPLAEAAGAVISIILPIRR